LFATEIVPSEQVTAGLLEGETVQARATVEGLSPPTGLEIVTFDCADAPGATEEGDKAVAERLKPGEVTGRLSAVEVLAMKLPSPL
jgi:hypothetical protein